MPLAADQLDNRIQIVTPENIAFHYRLAGPFRRLPAYLIDFVLRAGALALLAIPAGLLERVGVGVLLVCYFLASWFYGGLFETFWNGQTPGKRLLGLRVLTTNGQPINALQAVLRNILREVDSLPAVPVPGTPMAQGLIPLFSLGLASAMFTHRYQRLGDLVCGTMVVIEEREGLRGVAEVRDPLVVGLAGQIPPNFVVSRSLSRALAAYVERRGLLGPARRVEIARVLADPLRERCELPADTSPDLLLCALYYRAFIADRGGAARDEAPAVVAQVVEPRDWTAAVTGPAPAEVIAAEIVERP